MRDTRGFKLGGGEREEPLEHFYGFYYSSRRRQYLLPLSAGELVTGEFILGCIVM
jgi:hypothetical protein